MRHLDQVNSLIKMAPRCPQLRGGQFVYGGVRSVLCEIFVSRLKYLIEDFGFKIFYLLNTQKRNLRCPTTINPFCITL